MKPPWWFCCGWWSPWCVIDNLLHQLCGYDLSGAHWVCRKHDAAVVARLERGDEGGAR